MVKKIGIGLLCTLIVLTSIIATIPKANASVEFPSEYSKDDLEKIIFEQDTTDMFFVLTDLQYNPIEQTSPYYMTFNAEISEFVIEFYYTFEDKQVNMNITSVEIYGYCDIETNYGSNGNEIEQIQYEINYYQYEEGDVFHVLPITYDYDFSRTVYNFYNNIKLNLSVYFDFLNSYDVVNEETQVYLETYIYLESDHSDFEMYSILNERDPLINATNTNLDISMKGFDHDITNSTPLMQYKMMKAYENSFTEDDFFGETYGNIMTTVFTSFANILGVQVFPGVSIGLIIGLPLLLGLFLIILKLIRG